MRVLLVEDERALARLVEMELLLQGMSVEVRHDGRSALERALGEKFDIILLDWMLPDIEGIQVCRALRTHGSGVPIIMITAKSGVSDEVRGLDAGADDYIVKPFSPRELTLRVKAILRRGKAPAAVKEILKAGGITVDSARHRVTAGRKEIELTPMEFKLLSTLMERAGRVQSREQLLTDVWDIAADVDTRTIDTHIKRLREKLGKPGDAIRTVRGLGYQFREDDED
jgi:DNA-binding response OmpR family regulator